MPLLDIIIPSYNNKKELLDCLDGFSRQTIKDFILHVCIDGSTDNTVGTLKIQKYPFKFLIHEHPLKVNRGRNATRNLALSHLDSKFLLFFDSDIIPLPDLVENHYLLLKEKDCVSVGNVNYLNKETDLWAGYISKRGYNKFKPMQKMAPEYMNMGNLAMPTYYFTTLKGMDENLVKYGGDDSELAMRLEKTFSPEVINNSDAKGESVLNKTLDFALKQLEEFGEVNLKYIHQKHPGFGHVYAYDIMNGNHKYSRLFQVLMKDGFADILKKSIKYLPKNFKHKAVHYLSAYHLYKGFKKQLST